VRHRELIATTFRVGGLVLGIPSTLGLVCFGYGAARFYLLKPLPPADKSGNQLIDLLGLGVSLVAKVLVFFGGAVEWALAALSIVSFGCLAFAALLFFTGRGLHAGRGAPRVMGILLASLFLLVSFLGVTAIRKPVPLAVSSVILALSGYVIWALGWRFAG
jgi:hypothetical protein